MYSIDVSDGQSLLDVCLQELGDVAPAFDLADANGLAVTDALVPGQQLVVPASLLGQPAVARYFRKRGQRINTGNDTPASEPEGASAKYFSPRFFNTSFLE